MNLRSLQEHYPFWSQGRLNQVERVEVFARSSESSVPATIDVFQKPDKSDAGKMSTLKKHDAFRDLLRGLLTEGKPAVPLGELKMHFDNNTLADLWVAVTWSDSPN